MIEALKVSTADTATSTAGGAATITYAAVSGQVHLITGIAWSYDSAPTGGGLTVQDGSGTVVFSMSITAAGPGSVYFFTAKQGSINTAMIVTLAGGGGAVIGKVNVLGHQVR